MFLMISSRSSRALIASERAGLVISGSAAAVAHAGCQRLNAQVLVFGAGGVGGVVAGASGPAPTHAVVQPNAALIFACAPALKVAQSAAAIAAGKALWSRAAYRRLPDSPTPVVAVTIG